MTSEESSFRLGTAFRPETIGDEAVRAMVVVLDTQDEAPSIERLRAIVEAARAGWAFSTVTVFGFVCRKP